MMLLCSLQLRRGMTFCGRRKKGFQSGTDFRIYDRSYSNGLSDFFEKCDFVSFRQIQSRYNFPQKHFFGFLQVRQFIKSSFMSPANQPTVY